MSTVLDPHFKLKYVRFCFSDLYDDDKAQKYFGKLVWILFEI